MYIEHLVTGVPQDSVLRPLLFSTSSLGSDRHTHTHTCEHTYTYIDFYEKVN